MHFEGSESMSRQPAILLLSSDTFARADAADYLERCGYDVLQAKDGNQAEEVLRTRRGVNVLVTQVEYGDQIGGLAVAKTARSLNEKIVVVYASSTPNSIPEREKVSNAPSIRAPYSPRQIAALIAHMKQQPTLTASASY
jgi:DNA-binding NtrC family response regulator